MPSKKAVQSEAVVSPTSALAAAPVLAKSKVVRKRATAKATETGVAAPATKRSTGARKKAAVAADTTTVAAVTHRHKKQDAVSEIAAPTAGVSVPVAAYEPSHDEVAGLAYSYYVARGYQPGDPGADWFRAINELKQRHLAALLSDVS